MLLCEGCVSESSNTLLAKQCSGRAQGSTAAAWYGKEPLQTGNSCCKAFLETSNSQVSIMSAMAMAQGRQDSEVCVKLSIE